MDELAIKMAELLDIGVESAIDLYPVLRGQFMFYYVVNTISNFLGFITLLALFMLIALVIYYFMQLEYSDDKLLVKIKRYIKLNFYTILSMVALDIVLITLKVIFSPDIVLIQELLNKS